MTSNVSAQFGTWTVGVVQVEGRNLGTGTTLYNGTVGDQFSVLEFKSLRAGPGIRLDDSGDEITITSEARSIQSMVVNEQGHLIVFYTDSTSDDVGLLVSPPSTIGTGNIIPSAVTSSASGRVKNDYVFHDATGSLAMSGVASGVKKNYRAKAATASFIMIGQTNAFIA